MLRRRGGIGPESSQVTLYGWLPAIEGAQEGPSGEPIVDVTGSDILDALNGFFMGNAQFQKDKFGLYFDAVYTDLSTDANGSVGPIAATIGPRHQAGLLHRGRHLSCL